MARTKGPAQSPVKRALVAAIALRRVIVVAWGKLMVVVMVDKG
jgi:hypothetical protein